MSFLYQALIKEQQKEKTSGESTATPNSAQQQAEPVDYSAGIKQSYTTPVGNSDYAAEQKSGNSHWFWLTIGSLLAVVGLLGGYLFGSKSSNDNIVNAMQAQAAQAEQQQKQLEQTLVKAKEQALAEFKAEQAKQQAKQQAATAQASPENDTKQIQVALNSDGQVQTQVTNIQAAESYEEEDLVKRTILPEVSMEDIPQSLKSSFANAVEATQQKQSPELFESHVSSGSSLPLITDLKLSEIYWVPDIEYQMHIYASEPSERWIRLNNKTLVEGDELVDDLTLLEIRQDQIIWQSKSKRFAQNALEDFVKS